MTKIDLALDEWLMSVLNRQISNGHDMQLTVERLSKIISDTRTQSKQENDRIVNEGEVVSLSRIKS